MVGGVTSPPFSTAANGILVFKFLCPMTFQRPTSQWHWRTELIDWVVKFLIHEMWGTEQGYSHILEERIGVYMVPDQWPAPQSQGATQDERKSLQEESQSSREETSSWKKRGSPCLVMTALPPACALFFPPPLWPIVGRALFFLPHSLLEGSFVQFWTKAVLTPKWF